MERESLIQHRIVTEESETFAVLTRATREADELHQEVGGGTRHWLRECFLPALEKHGLAVVDVKTLREDLALTTARSMTFRRTPG